MARDGFGMCCAWCVRACLGDLFVGLPSSRIRWLFVCCGGTDEPVGTDCLRRGVPIDGRRDSYCYVVVGGKVPGSRKRKKRGESQDVDDDGCTDATPYIVQREGTQLTKRQVGLTLAVAKFCHETRGLNEAWILSDPDPPVSPCAAE